MSEASEFPLTMEAAYGQLLSRNIEKLLYGAASAAVYVDGPIPSSASSSLEEAVGILSGFFPRIRTPRITGSSDEIFRSVKSYITSLLKAGQPEMDALCRARLYGGTVTSKTVDLVGDRALSACAGRDAYALKILLKDAYMDTTSGVYYPAGHVHLPEDLQQSALVATELASNVSQRNFLLSRLKVMLREFSNVRFLNAAHSRTNLGSIEWLGRAKGAWVVEEDEVTSVRYGDGMNDFQTTAIANAGELANGEVNVISGFDDTRSSGSVIIKGNNVDNLNTTSHRVTASFNSVAEEVNGSMYFYHSDPALAMYNVVFDGGAVVLTGATDGSVLTTNGKLWYSEMILDSNTHAFVFKWRPNTIGVKTLKIVGPNVVPAAGAIVATRVSVDAVGNIEDIAAPSSDVYLQAVQDVDAKGMIRDFLHMRSLLDTKNVGPGYWLKAYAPFLFSDPAPYLTNASLTEEAQTAIRSRLLAIDLWSSFYDVKGFIAKLYDDMWSLYALAQVSQKDLLI